MAVTGEAELVGHARDVRRRILQPLQRHPKPKVETEGVERSAGRGTEHPAEMPGRYVEARRKSAERERGRGIADQLGPRLLGEIAMGIRELSGSARFAARELDHAVHDAQHFFFGFELVARAGHEPVKQDALAEVELRIGMGVLEAEGARRIVGGAVVGRARDLARHLLGKPEPVAPVALGMHRLAGVFLAGVVDRDDARVSHEGARAGVPDPDPGPGEGHDVVLGGPGVTEAGVVDRATERTHRNVRRGKDLAVDQHGILTRAARKRVSA